MLLKAALFDLNNVAENFVAINEGLASLVSTVLSEIGHSDAEALSRASNITSQIQDRYQRTPLHYYPSFWEFVATKAFEPRKPPKGLAEELFTRFLHQYEARIGIYEDFLPCLRHLRQARNLRLAVLANGHPARVEKFLSKYRIRDHVDAVVVSGATPWRKPDPEIFRFTLDYLGVSPCEAIHVGDRGDTDVAGGNRTGLWTARILRGTEKSRLPKAAVEVPDYVISHLSELTDLPLLQREAVESAVVVCGGRGARLGSLGDEKQKCLVPIGGIPILDRVTDRLISCGVTDFHFILGYRADEVEDHLRKTWCFHGVRMSFHRPGAGSTGEAISRCLEQLPEQFFYCHGDIVIPEAFLKDLLKNFFLRMASVVATTANPTAPSHPVVQVQSGRIEKVRRHLGGCSNGNWQWSIGISILKSADLAEASRSNSSGTVEELLRPSVNSAFAVELSRPWFHLETAQDIEQFPKLSLEGVRHA